MRPRALHGAVLAVALAAPAALPQSLPPASSVVKPTATASPASVPRGHTFEVAVVAKILPGFHIQANKPSKDYLIPTTLAAQPPAGLHTIDTAYPPGSLRKFGFSPEKLLVYDGSVTFRMKLAVEKNAPLGKLTLPLTLRYQACNDTTCLAPVKIPIGVSLEVVAARAARTVAPRLDASASIGRR